MVEASKLRECKTCKCDLAYSEEQLAWEKKHLNMPCDCESGKLAKDCHPEYFDAQCSMCECEGEIQD